MKRREWLEWLGLAPADLFGWSAFLAIVVMYFIQQTVVDVLLACVAVGLSLLACVIGMPSDPALSPTSNRLKKLTYPILVFLVLVAIIFHFTAWDGMRQFWLGPTHKSPDNVQQKPPPF